jgi:sugar transferase
MRPGLTGLLEIERPHLLNWDERMRIDAGYVDNWSLWLDGLLLARGPFKHDATSPEGIPTLQAADHSAAGGMGILPTADREKEGDMPGIKLERWQKCFGSWPMTSRGGRSSFTRLRAQAIEVPTERPAIRYVAGQTMLNMDLRKRVRQS